ncbi:uncharacterized protein LOC132708199 [Cylas formicarius]|uniref:uncharacterized protein LOC132708199 n=1 Tax=Cylas formicarius TaxID=197179 RepID=UPI00295885BB|nr:uncharacterized protein LOC132708199 [Cylas formicarius]
MVVSNLTLVKIASITGMATATMGYLLRSKLNDKIKNAVFYKEALKTVRSHSAAVYLLGEPIKDKSIDVGNRNKNFFEDNVAQLEVPLKGSKQNGTLFLWAKKEENDWLLTRIELEVENLKNKRLIIKKSEN